MKKHTTVEVVEMVQITNDVNDLSKQYTDAPSVLRAIAHYGDRTQGLFALLLSYITSMLAWEIDNDLPEDKRMTPADLGNYFRDALGAQYTAYRLKGERIVPDPQDNDKRKPVYEISKTVANLVSMLNRKTAEMARVLESKTVKDLDSNTRAAKKEADKPTTLGQAIEQETLALVKKETARLMKDNGGFRGDLIVLLTKYGADLNIQMEEVTTFRRKASK